MEISYTYLNNRKCKKCGAKISDQAHALQKFCKRVELSDGTILSCKDDYHAAIRITEKEPFRRIAKHHENMRNLIKELNNQKGNLVNLESIKRAGIQLNRAVEVQFSKEDGLHKYYFVEFLISKIDNLLYKITKHDTIF